NLINSLEWRYARKKMNGQSVPQQKIDIILEAIRLAPTSMGVQPFSVLVIKDPETRKKILPVAYNQSQITDCSHLVIFAIWSTVTEARLDAYVKHLAEVRHTTIDSQKGFHDMITGSLLKLSTEQQQNWASRQAYLALGVGITAAAAEMVDATPMEGFNPAGLDELLGLEEKGLQSVCMLALGYRDSTQDWLEKLAKVRRQKENFFIHI
ncbi:MAG: NAD(P)H-dependent oxidoreductase, partial [Bacteroidota bacterium]